MSFFRSVCFVFALAPGLLTGCVMTSLSEVESDPEFAWDTLKRDQILMTPLLDLRGEVTAPPGHAGDVAFMTAAQQGEYAEAFKQRFFHLRRDIRVFGAGGAFEYLARQPRLRDLAAQMLRKEPLAPADLQLVRDGTQDIRFVFVFAIDRERLSYDVSYTFRDDDEKDAVTYRSQRQFAVKMALWDARQNKTVWVGTKRLDADASQTVAVVNPSKRLVKEKANNKEGFRLVWVGRRLPVSLSGELRAHPGRFPAFAGREPALSASFEDFALGLPIQPDEQQVIAYKWFTYHRPEARLSVAGYGEQTSLGFQLGTSSIIANRYRFGGALMLPLPVGVHDAAGNTATISATGFGLSFDREWQLREDWRLLGGAMLASYAFAVKPEAPVGASAAAADTRRDGAGMLSPRLQLLYGQRAGFQMGIGASYRLFSGVDDPVLKHNRPSPWAAEVAVAYAVRGF